MLISPLPATTGFNTKNLLAMAAGLPVRSQSHSPSCAPALPAAPRGFLPRPDSHPEPQRSPAARAGCDNSHSGRGFGSGGRPAHAWRFGRPGVRPGPQRGRPYQRLPPSLSMHLPIACES